MFKKNLAKIALFGAFFYFFVLWVADLKWFLIRKAYLIGLIEDPDGAITYFRFWFSYTPWSQIFKWHPNFFFIQIANSAIWALIFAVIYSILYKLWAKKQK